MALIINNNSANSDTNSPKRQSLKVIAQIFGNTCLVILYLYNKQQNMATESRTVQTYLEIETIDIITRIAEKEKRTLSNMIAVLLWEAVTAREQSHKTEKQHA